jgi:adenosylcobalamin-dependent ribonucleoside-diphosphate reductase
MVSETKTPAQPGEAERNSPAWAGFRTPLAEKIFLDRYALKSMDKEAIRAGDVVVYCPNPQEDEKRRRREIGVVTALDRATKHAAVRPRDEPDAQPLSVPLEHLDKPLELHRDAMYRRVARAIATAEPEGPGRAEAEERFFEALSAGAFVPGGRILAGAGVSGLTFYNCFVLPSPHDSRRGIMETAAEQFEIMSRGGGVGINVSSLRPRYDAVGELGRSSGAVSWADFYSYLTGKVEQGGCFSPETRLATDRGLVRAADLAGRVEAGAVISASTHRGPRRLVRAFRNGTKPLFRVTTKRGFSVDVTGEHRMAVLDGSRIGTVPLADLRIGDEVLTLLEGGDSAATDYVELRPVIYNRSVMSTALNEDVSLPPRLTESLAYLLGYACGDGYVHVAKKVTWSAPKALKLSVPQARPEIIKALREAAETIFGIVPTVESGDGACVNVVIYSRLVIEWLSQNGLLKAKTPDVRVPEAIFHSRASVVRAFLSGYFDADGCDRAGKGGYSFDSVSLGMVRDVQLLLAANGIASHINTTQREQANWRTVHRLCITGAEFREKADRFLAMSYKSKHTAGRRNQGNNYPMPVWMSLGVPHPSRYHSGLVDVTKDRISYRALARIRERLATDGLAEWASRVDELLRVLPDRIRSIEALGPSEVIDFEVEDVHLLSGNGVYTSNSRRGALMIVLDVWHPDVEQFVEAKHKLGTLDNANISVAVSDAFMAAVEHDAEWPLVFPDRGDADYNTTWDGDLRRWQALGRPVNVYKTVRARDLYDRICRSAWASAEPGLFFVDRVNALSNSYYCQSICCTNPCGEEPLPPWGVCNLGALNLSVFVRATPEGKYFWPTVTDDVLPSWEPILERLDLDRLAVAARTGVDFLDDVIEKTPYLFRENEEQQRAERRVGLGVMGLAELLIRAGIPYGSELALKVVDRLFEVIRDAAYEESIALARRKGPFPRFDAEKYLQSGYARLLPPHLRDGIAQNGIRNVTLLTVAPTGTTGTMMGTSTGIEPYFLFRFESRSRLGAHVVNEPVVGDYCREMGLPEDSPLPPQFQTTEDLTPRQHVLLMAAAQRYVDAAISKTCNLPNQFTVEDVKAFYQELYRLGCKGGTVYRDGSRAEQALVKLPGTEKTGTWRPGDPAAKLVKPLPDQPREGYTHSVLTPLGRVHITLNLDPADGSPFDIFIALSKAGSDTDADTDAIGRLLSLLLRLNVDVPSRARLDLAIDQFRGIATSRSAGFGPGRVRSVPDGIAKCLEELLAFLERQHPAAAAGALRAPEKGAPAAGSADGEPPPAAGDGANGQAAGPPPAAGSEGRRRTYLHMCPACGNAAAAFVDGCFKCFGCGYTEC